jgi:hypothetical protein
MISFPTEKTNRIIIQYIALRIKIPEIIAKIFAINNCDRASYFFGLCEYSVNKNLSIEEKNG